MSNSERENLIEGLRGVFCGEGAGIDLDSPDQWVLENIREPIRFFRALPVLLSEDATLYMEGTTISPFCAGFYERHAAANIVPVVRDTLSPIPDIFHVSFNAAVINGLCELAGERQSGELFDHIKAYSDGTLIFTFHDAFEGQLRISSRKPELLIGDFCAATGATYTREPTKQRDLGQLREILRLLENPTGTRTAPLSSWKRLWRFITFH